MPSDDPLTAIPAARAAAIAGYSTPNAWHNAVRNGTAPAPIPDTSPRRWLLGEVSEFAARRCTPTVDDAGDTVTCDQVRRLIGARDQGSVARKVASGTLPPPGMDGTWDRETLRTWLAAGVPLTVTGEHYVPTRHAAAMLKTTPRALAALVRKGVLPPPVRAGRAHWWNPDDLTALSRTLDTEPPLVGATHAARLMGMSRQGWLYRVAHAKKAPQPVRENPLRWLRGEVEAYCAQQPVPEVAHRSRPLQVVQQPTRETEPGQ